MEDVELFLSEVEKDEKLLERINRAKNIEEICKIAKSYGYYFTEKYLEDYCMERVSGGTFVDSTSYNVQINQTVGGEHNTAINFGNAGINSDFGGSDDQNINEMKKAYAGAAMNMVLNRLGQILGR